MSVNKVLKFALLKIKLQSTKMEQNPQKTQTKNIIVTLLASSFDNFHALLHRNVLSISLL